MSAGIRAGSSNDGYLQVNGVDIMPFGANLAIGRLINIVVITASGTYIPTAGALRALLKGQGAGGGGGGVAATSSSQVAVGGGGGAGGMGELFIPSLVPYLGGTPIVIGNGGAGGVLGNPGQAGQASSLMGMTLNGGSGGGSGAPAAANSLAGGGGGGTVLGGTIGTTGWSGSNANATFTNQTLTVSGRGANSLYGQGGAAVVAGGGANAGAAAQGRGAGGSGAAAFGAGSGNNGGAGSAAIFFVYEFA